MRMTFADSLKDTDYLLHADMWNTERFPSKAKIINCNLGESNLVNVAAGIASEGNTVYIYGVAEFIIHRYEQLKFSAREFGSHYGKIVIVNAGKYGYEKFGAGHLLDDDLDIMKALKISFYDPETLYEFKNNLAEINSYPNGIFYIRLGKDSELQESK
jgi:transketolase